MVDAVKTEWVRVSHHTPEHMAKHYWLASYGSNLDLTQFAARCPSAELVGRGTINKARFRFAGVATIVPDDKASVPVGVAKMTANDIRALDRFEGLHRFVYDRMLVAVDVEGVGVVRCYTYIKRVSWHGVPSASYYARILSGYRSWGFDDRRLRHAREVATKNDSWARRKAKPRSAEAPGAQVVPSFDALFPRGNRGKAANYNSTATFPGASPPDAVQIKANGTVTWTNPRNGERWRMGPNNVWIRDGGGE